MQNMPHIAPTAIRWSRLAQIALVTGLVVATVSPVWASNWEQEISKDGISVYSREVSGSSLNEVKGVTHMNTTIESLVAVMDDTGASTKWIHNCKEARVAKKISIAERVTYTVVDAPWPLDDRDMYVHSKIAFNRAKKQITIRLTGKENFKGTHKDRVRVRSLKGLWVFTETKNGKVRVSYQLYNDPQAPSDSAANGALEESVFESLKGMRQMVRQPKYKNFKFSEEMRQAIEI